MLICRFFLSLLLLAVTTCSENPLQPPRRPSLAQCNGFLDDEKLDCFAEGGSTQMACEARGCCYAPSESLTENSKLPPIGVPNCYYPLNYGGYKYTNVSKTETGQLAFMQRTFASPYPRDVSNIRVDVEYQTDSILHIKMSDANNQRWESPYPKIENKADKAAVNPLYEVNIDEEKTGIQVTRSDGSIIFDSQDLGGFIFADQFLQVTTTFNGTIYGIGEHRSNLWHELNWTRLTLWNRDIPPNENTNLYGSHAFYMVMEPSSGRSYGVYLHNSNAMDILLQPKPLLTFRTIGGILDFYMFLGPSPADVLRQYTQIIGRSLLPPYWSLGFHLCRNGYGSTEGTREVWQRNRNAGIPFDTQWNDIEYMLNNNDFTVNEEIFGNITEFIDEVHAAGMRYIPIVDPGVSPTEKTGSYPPYDLGVEKDIFVKDNEGNIFLGHTWNPVSTAYPDFTNPNALEYWETLLRKFHERVPFDGIWIDMNEPSNFLDGGVNGCPNNNLETPPYTPGVEGDILSKMTFCMSAVHAVGTHYNAHNLYGISEAEVTNKALRLMGKRPVVVSRSTFSGSGKYTGHWGGDNKSTWYDLVKSVGELLQFNLYGIPFMGSDICGFIDDTNAHLCNRWTQLGAFYVFSRNHNNAGTVAQDPAAWNEDVVLSIRKALIQRYTLLPYLYTLLYHAHVDGDTVARPLFVEFPNDPNTYHVDRSFLWGSGLYVIPVLEENATSVNAYLPAGRWYDWYTGFGGDSIGAFADFDAPFDTIPLYVRGGVILPTQAPAVSTSISRKNNFTLIAAADLDGNASGTLYWDDGEVIDPIENNKYGSLKFRMSGKEFKSEVQQWKTQDTPLLETIKVFGSGPVERVTVNGNLASFSVDSRNVLSVTNLNIPLNTDIVATWD